MKRNLTLIALLTVPLTHAHGVPGGTGRPAGGLKVGDRVRFDAEPHGGVHAVTRIERLP